MGRCAFASSCFNQLPAVAVDYRWGIKVFHIPQHLLLIAIDVLLYLSFCIVVSYWYAFLVLISACHCCLCCRVAVLFCMSWFDLVRCIFSFGYWLGWLVGWLVVRLVLILKCLLLKYYSIPLILV